jgi:ribosome-associated toxin RatA of RatAB toxin-antitoxin module
MRTATIDFLLPDADAGAAYARLCDFERYADHTDAVRGVRITDAVGRPDGPRVIESEWEVNFRNGVLCWSERDQLDPARRTIRFDQLDGDFERFDGDWAVRQAGPDVTVRFTATFDLGMPSLAEIIEPVADRTLRENICRIVRGVLGDRLIALDALDVPSAA